MVDTLKQAVVIFFNMKNSISFPTSLRLYPTLVNGEKEEETYKDKNRNQKWLIHNGPAE
jgi:hypothetical protein